MKTIVEVKCPTCGKKREIEPDEIGADSFPMCDKCLMPMFVEKVQVKNK